jgi:hypothetical protein
LLAGGSPDFPLKREIPSMILMPEVKVSTRKFKEWVSVNLSPNSPLSEVMRREKDELALDEAIAKTEMICALIDTSVTSEALLKRGSLKVR